MSMRINIENILKSHKSVFQEILAKITQNNIDVAKQELQLNTKLDTVLFDAINLTVEQLKKEEGLISRFLYHSFGIGKNKNKRREQLILLGSQLKTQYTQTNKTLLRAKHYHENLYSSLKNLSRLRKGFNDKIAFLPSTLLQERSHIYIQQIDAQINTVNEYQSTLDEKIKLLKYHMSEYERLFKKIPRYHELREEIYLELVAPKEN